MPLHFLAARGLLSATGMLAEKGANIELANNAGSTPFHKAANTGQLQVPQKLVELKANINAQAAGWAYYNSDTTSAASLPGFWVDDAKTMKETC